MKIILHFIFIIAYCIQILIFADTQDLITGMWCLILLGNIIILNQLK